MGKIKILAAIRQGKVGGGETHVLDLCTNLNKDIYEPVVLSLTEGQMVDELRNRGIRTKVINTTNPFDLSVFRKIYAFIKSQQFDIIHAHGTRANSNVVLPAKLLNIPLLYTVHGWSFHQDQGRITKTIRTVAESLLTKSADNTICVSKDNQEEGKKLLNLKRSSVIYNAVDVCRFNPYRSFAPIRQQLGISDDSTVVGFIVRMTKQKDPFTMLYAMKEVLKKAPSTVLLMVGDGELKQKSIALSHKLGIYQSIRFQPFRSDIPDILNAIDIYCLPSLWEGFPIGILEAMAMGKAVVASAVGGTKELINDGINGLHVNPGNINELADKLYDLIKDQSKRERLGRNAEKNVLDNFTIQSMVTQTEKEYKTLLMQKQADSGDEFFLKELMHIKTQPFDKV